MIDCKFCGKSKKSVEAHIIPEAFFEDINPENHMLRERSPGIYPKKRPNGVYDDGIWCFCCEKTYEFLDSQVIGILKTPFEVMRRSGDTYFLNAFSNLNLVLFFVSMLWRAAHSSKDLYSQIKIGEYCDAAKFALQNKTWESVERFSVILAYTGHDNHIIVSPVSITVEGVELIRFNLGRLTAFLKIDEKPLPDILKNVAVKEFGTIEIIKIPRYKDAVELAAGVAKEMQQSKDRKKT